MLPIHLTSRLGVLAVGFLAVILIGFPPEAEKRWRIYSNDLLDLPARWDTGWYLGIATAGRPEAILDLKWDQVDLTGGVIHLNPTGRIQTNKQRPTVRIDTP